MSPAQWLQPEYTLEHKLSLLISWWKGQALECGDEGSIMIMTRQLETLLKTHLVAARQKANPPSSMQGDIGPQHPNYREEL